MTDIDLARLRRLDLTVLLVFVEVMRHRRTTEAAQRLGLTQSAISHSLKRLREVFADPLFLRRPHGLEPTARALDLKPVVAQVIEALSGSFQQNGTFDPALLDRPLRIGAYDAVMATVVPGLMAELAAIAPASKLVVRPISRTEAVEALQDGSLDLAIGYFFSPNRDVIIEPLYTERYRVVMRKGHPLLGSPLSTAAYASARHLIVSPAGDLTGIVDAALAVENLTREVVAAIPLFFPAMAALPGTDLIATVPSRMAEGYAEVFGLVAVDPPLPIRSFDVSLARHRRNAKSGMINWLSGLIRSGLR
jgi:DNA-binding transcriptional LysR family regulator